MWGPEYDWADGVRLVLNELGDRHDSAAPVPGREGNVTFRVRRDGFRVVVETDARQPWSVRRPGFEASVAPAGTFALELDWVEA